MEGLFAMGVVKPESFHAALATTKGTKENMKALIFTLAVAIFPCAAQAGEAVTYMVDGETFEGYRAAASGDAKELVLIIHDWDGLTEYEMKRADMLADMGYDAFAIDLFGKGNRPTDIRKRASSTRTEIACVVSSSAASKRHASQMTKRPW
jgi:Dienelactone hydrolase family